MLERTIYTCEKCGLEVEDDYEMMIEHEYGHVEPKSLQKPQATKYSPDKLYPLMVIVEMDNGARVRYISPVEIEPPTEKESPSETD